jgi:MFS family permease
VSADARQRAGLVAVIAEGILSRLSFGIIGFLLPLWARRLGLSLAEIGVLVALNSAVSIAAKPAMGWAADRFGLKRAFVSAVALRSLVSLLLVGASAAWQLWPIRALHGLAAALRDPAANVLLAENGGEQRVASAFAWYQTAKTASGSASKALAGFLLAAFAGSFPAVFLCAFALSALPLVVVIWAVPAGRRDPGARSREAPRPAAAPARPRGPVLRFAGVGFLVAASAEMLSQLFPVLAVEHAGLTEAQAGVVAGIGTALGVAAGPCFGWLSDRVSRGAVLAVRSVANVLSSVLYLVLPGLAGVAIARGVDDLGKAAFRPAWGALMAEVAAQDPRSRARIVSWLGMGEDAGGVVGPILAGLLWSGFGIGAVMAARVLLAIAGEVYTVRATRPRELADAPPPAAENA